MNRKYDSGVLSSLASGKGFTFIELMMVVVIIGILAAVIVPRLVNRSGDAKIAAAKADIEAISLSLDLYSLDNGKFPSTSQGLEALNRKPATHPVPPKWKGPYMKKKSSFVDPWGNKYIYVSPGVHDGDYDIESYGPDGQDGGEDDIESWQEN